MNQNNKSSENFTAVIGIAFTILFIFLLVWFMRSLPMPAQDNKPTAEEAARYEDYKSEQQLNSNGKQEACRDQMDRDVERYGEQVIDTYDCSQ